MLGKQITTFGSIGKGFGVIYNPVDGNTIDFNVPKKHENIIQQSDPLLELQNQIKTLLNNDLLNNKSKNINHEIIQLVLKNVREWNQLQQSALECKARTMLMSIIDFKNDELQNLINKVGITLTDKWLIIKFKYCQNTSNNFHSVELPIFIVLNGNNISMNNNLNFLYQLKSERIQSCSPQHLDIFVDFLIASGYFLCKKESLGFQFYDTNI